MKAKRLLSLLLTLVMLVSALATVAIYANTDDVTVSSITFLARKAKAGDTADRKDRPLSTRDGYGEALAFDGQLDTHAQTYGFSSYFKHYYLDTDGTFKYDLEDNTAKGVYYGLFVIELTAASTLDNMTIWGSSDKTSEIFANDGYDIFYSADGTTYTAVTDASFSSMLGANKGKFSVTETVGEDTYYGHQIDMGDVNAKYVVIAISAPTNNSNKDAVLREVTFNDEVQQVTPVVPVEPSENVVIETIFNLGKRTKHDKAEGAVAIEYTDDRDFSNIHDGDYSNSTYSSSIGSDYVMSTVFNDGSFVTQNESYRDVIIIKLEQSTLITDITVWGDSDKKDAAFMNNKFTVFYSNDGTNYEYVGRADDMCGDGVANEGANADLASETKTVENATYYGIKFKVNGNDGANATHIAIAVEESSNLESRVVLNEVTFNNGAAVAVAEISAIGMRTKASYYDAFNTKLTYNGVNALTAAVDGDYSTYALSGGLTSDSRPSVKFVQKKFVVTKGLLAGSSYQDVIVIKFANPAILNNMTVWGDTDKNSASFITAAFDIYYSADGETYTYVGGVSRVTGDGFSEGANADLAYYTHTVGTDTYYGINFDMDDVTAGYVAIAISQKNELNGGRTLVREVTFNDAEQAAPETPDGGEEEPAGPTQMGIGIQSVEMPWRSYDALVSADADKELCATKMYDGDIKTGSVWRYNSQYKDHLKPGGTELTYVKSIVDGKMVAFDGEASDNDFYDYIIMDLSNDDEDKAYDVSVLRWWVNGDPTCISNAYSVYTSADGINWTHCQSFEEMVTGYGPVYKYDKEAECLYHDIEVNQDAVRYVMLTIEYGRTTHDFLMWNVKELVVYEKGTEPKEEPKEENNNNNNNPNNNPKPNPTPDTSAPETNAPETDAAVAAGKAGCGGSIGMGAVAVVAITGAALSFARKRKED